MTEAYPVPSPGLCPERCAQVFPGEPGQVPRARAFVASALAGCPAREALLTCVSELAANAIAHTASGDGGVFTVEVVRPAVGVAQVAVTDAGAPQEPADPAEATGPADAGDEPSPADDLESLPEGGRGLLLVAACSSRWGYHDADSSAGGDAGRTVWAEATWPVAVAAK